MYKFKLNTAIYFYYNKDLTYIYEYNITKLFFHRIYNFVYLLTF